MSAVTLLSLCQPPSLPSLRSKPLPGVKRTKLPAIATSHGPVMAYLHAFFTLSIDQVPQFASIRYQCTTHARFTIYCTYNKRSFQTCYSVPAPHIQISFTCSVGCTVIRFYSSWLAGRSYYPFCVFSASFLAAPAPRAPLNCTPLHPQRYLSASHPLRASFRNMLPCMTRLPLQVVLPYLGIQSELSSPAVPYLSCLSLPR